jgi:hypothetical protein
LRTINPDDMFLKIDDQMTIGEVQDRFQECFPFLRIAFYSKGHKKFAISDKRYQHDGKMRIANVRKNHYNGVLEIKSWQTTARIEKELKDDFGLHAQIFRQDGKNGWVQTSLSDDFTLQQQGEIGSGLQ